MCVHGKYVAAFMQALSIEWDHVGTQTMQLAMRNTCAPLQLLTCSHPMWDSGEGEPKMKFAVATSQGGESTKNYKYTVS